MKRRILVVDDEKNIVDIVAFNLQKEGYEVVTATDGLAGLELARNQSFDLILLDIMMPKMDGFDVCKKIREKSQVPIIMLTARVSEVDKVLGLELGADDYVTKPFGVRELMARVKANTRRQDQPPTDEESSLLTFGELVIDTKKHEARKNDSPLDLTNKEFELLKFLATRQEEVFTREMLLEKVWGYEFFGDVRNVDVTIRRLRAKIEDCPETPKYIITKRAVGYYFAAQ